MANIIDIPASNRSETGTGRVGRVRRSGNIPAVLYGKKVQNTNLVVDTKTFTKVINSSASDNILVNLKLDGGEQLALVQEVQHDHIKGGILHVDFHAIAMDEEIHAAVPVETVGEAAGAKMGGQLEILLHTLEVRCLPKDLPEKITIDVSALNVGEGVHVKDLPEKITVDISHLNIEDAVHVRELNLPEGVRVKLDGDVVVVILEEPKEAEAAPAAPAADAKAPAAKAGDAKAAAPAAAAKPAAKK